MSIRIRLLPTITEAPIEGMVFYVNGHPRYEVRIEQETTAGWEPVHLLRPDGVEVWPSE